LSIFSFGEIWKAAGGDESRQLQKITFNKN